MKRKNENGDPSDNNGLKSGSLEEHRIGIKLKHARMVKGLRLKDVAERANCSESLISKIENGRANPSVSMLHRIANVLGTNIGHLFATSDENGRVVQRYGERPVIETNSLRRGLGVTLERLVPNVEGSLLQGAIHVLDIGGVSDEGISHEGEEIGYVLIGKLELYVDGQAYTLNEGDSFYFRSELAHRYRNIHEGTTKVIWINTPPTF